MAQRVILPIKVGGGFDPSNANHRKKLMDRVESLGHGTDWELESVNDGVAQLVQIQSVVELVETTKDVRTVKLTPGTPPNAGDKFAAKFSDQLGPGWEMTAFEPFLNRATMEKLPSDVSLCRRATATALGVKPWDVKVHRTKAGGYLIKVPDSYVSSKHDTKLEEVATEVVGRDGWYLKTDHKARTVEFIPSAPPTFPAAFPTPLGKPIKFDHTNPETFKIPIGHKLPEPGVETGDIMYLDTASGAHSQVGGVSGGGKSVLINCYLSTWLSRGAELVIIDLPSKSADFEWCKAYVRPGGWGCDSPAQAAVAIELVMQEGERRAKVLKGLGENDWKNLPKGEGFTPLVVIVDELTGLLATTKPPPAGKDAPEKMKALKAKIEMENFHKELLKNGLKRAAAELRFVGVFLLLATQVASATTGIDPALRTNLHNKILMGAKPTEGNRKIIFSNADAVPVTPDNIKADGKASRGVGAAEPEGQEPCLFKSYFAPIEAYAAWLSKMNIPTTDHPEPTPAQMAMLDDDGEDIQVGADEIASRRAAMGDPVAKALGMPQLDGNGGQLKGAAAAAAQSAYLEKVARQQQAARDAATASLDFN